MENEQEKVCTVCGTCKVLTEFYRSAKGKNGLSSQCKECNKEWAKRWRERNKERVKEWERANLEMRRVWARKNYAEHRTKILKRKADSRKRRPAVYKMLDAMKYAKRKNGYCAWANLMALQAIYDLARNLTETTGIPHHVDHIVPLTHPDVQGLHVEHNLRVVKAKHNMAKGNKLLAEDCP